MKTALVTGGNKGIGYEVCRELIAADYRVFLSARNRTKGEAAAKELGAEFLLMDISNEQSIEIASAELMTRTQKLDALVNNAGVFIERQDEGIAVSSAIIKQTFETNTVGAFLVTRAMLPLLEAAKGASVVNVSSGMGQLSDMRDGSLAYRFSKTALNAITCSLASELSDKRITVNSVCPGWVKTDMGGQGATRTVAQGAETIVWLAKGEANATAKFYRDKQVIAW